MSESLDRHPLLSELTAGDRRVLEEYLAPLAVLLLALFPILALLHLSEDALRREIRGFVEGYES